MKKLLVSFSLVLLVILGFINTDVYLTVAEETSTQTVTEASTEAVSQKKDEETKVSTERTQEEQSASSTVASSKSGESKSTVFTKESTSNNSSASSTNATKSTIAETKTNAETTSTTAAYRSNSYYPALSGTDTTLSSLVVKNYSLSPVFSSNTVDYTLRVGENVNSVTISATPKDKNSDWRIVGYGKAVNNEIKVDLETGKNIIKVVCTSGEGYSKTYRITITKEGKVTEKSTQSLDESQTDEDISETGIVVKNNSRVGIIITLIIIEVIIVATVLYLMLHKAKKTEQNNDKEDL